MTFRMHADGVPISRMRHMVPMAPAGARPQRGLVRLPPAADSWPYQIMPPDTVLKDGGALQGALGER